MRKGSLLLMICGCFITSGFSQIIQDTIYHEKIYIGTGEYNPIQDWHGILRFDDAANYNSGPLCDTTYTPEGVIPIHACSTGTMFLNFEHGMYLDETHDRMYVSTLFTNPANILTTNPDTAVGSIAIFDNISTLTGGQTPTRHIFGDSTGLRQPHGCWLDETNDRLYVANSFGCNILVFNNASTRDGNTPPDRIISHPSLSTPVYIFLDEPADRMFVACSGIGCGGLPKVCIYNNASTVNGIVQPIIRIEGSNTRLGYRNPTVHNVWYNTSNGLLAVGHHTHEMLFFDMNTVNLNPGAPTTYNMTPRVLMINDEVDLSDTVNHNLYGFYWDEERDIMYASDGITNGGPQPGSPPNVLKVFENVSDTSVHGVTVPDRTICWDYGATYFPPQPIWVQKSMTFTYIGIENQLENTFQLYPNPVSDECMIKLPSSVENLKVVITNGVGQIISNYFINGTELKIDTRNWSKGMYFVQINGLGTQRLMKQ